MHIKKKNKDQRVEEFHQRFNDSFPKIWEGYDTRSLTDRTYGLLIVPEEGGKFRLENMTPIVRSLFQRISQIWEVPIEELLPLQISIKHKKSVGGRYSLTHNLISVADYPYSKGPEKLVHETNSLEHELIHSALAVISPIYYSVVINEHLKSRILDRDEKRIKDYWRLFKLSKNYFCQRWRENPYMESLTDTASTFRGLRLYSTYELALIDFMDGYGIDGVIVLSVQKPPLKTKKEIIETEEEYLRRGYLQEPSEREAGRLTDEGMIFLRNQIPQTRIKRRLRLIETNQKRLRLRE
ncbi:MAG: hypothetical protein V1875_02455 [Candidatus Altiarchaeota archaeon]